MFSRPNVHKIDLMIQEHRKHMECLAPALETTKTADKVKKSDIPITQIGDKTKVVGEDRRQSKY